MTTEEALELRTAMVGPKGKKKQITRLPEWLKTPIPVGENFKQIKNDLRGLNLHTGKHAGSFYIVRLSNDADRIGSQSVKKPVVLTSLIVGAVPTSPQQQRLSC